MIAIISRYGWHGPKHLEAMLRADDRRAMDTEYIATVLWSIGRILGGDDYSIPTYDEVMHPQAQDTRTAQQIVDGLRAKLLEGGE